MTINQEQLAQDFKLERYLVQSKLGEGGFGKVFKGYDEKLRRTVAIKVLPRNRLSLLEAQILAKLDNPHIVKIHDFVESHQSDYLVMEYIPHSPIMEQQLTLTEILTLGIQVCSGLAEIHGQGYVHQDIKPGNILRDTKTGNYKITDFGVVAKTKSGEQEIIGTPKFMAPEQRRGGIVDQRADLYGLAKVITALIHHNQLQVVPAKLGQILRKATQANPSHRYQSAEDFKAALIKLQLSLESWQMMEEVLPDLGDGMLKIKDLLRRRKLVQTLAKMSLGMLVTAIVMRLSLVELAAFYQVNFQLYLAPLIVGLVAAYSLPLATCLVFLLLFPPLMVGWASLGLLYGLAVVLLSPMIYRYPLIFLSLILALLWPEPLLILALPMLAGYYHGLTGSLLQGVLLPFFCFIVAAISETPSYLELLGSPLPINHGNWLITSISQVSLSELGELLALTGNFYQHIIFDYGVLGFILGIGAALLAPRGKLGLWFYISVTGLGFLFARPSMLGYWLAVSTLLLLSIYIQNRIKKIGSNLDGNQLWNKPTLACKKI